MKFERIGASLYRKGDAIYARVRVKGKLTWRSTGTNEPRDARKWIKKWQNDEWLLANGIEPKGIVLQRQRVTVGELIDAYVKAGMPTRKMQRKAEAIIQGEIACLKPVRAYFGGTPAATITLAIATSIATGDWQVVTSRPPLRQQRTRKWLE